MSPGTDVLFRVDSRFPRVSGDEPIHLTDARGHFQFSPRERG